MTNTLPPRIELHSHTFLSDGELSPMELCSRARDRDLRGLAITDHADAGIVDRLIDGVEPAARAAEEWGMTVVPGVELTHVPADRIADAAERARRAGAGIVVVHGETLVEPVPEGTNAAAAACEDVDVLGHPGLIDEDVARTAADHDVALEVTSRRGHCLTNGHVVDVAREVGADLVVDSDAHAPPDLMDVDRAWEVAKGAGMTDDEARQALVDVPERILEQAAKDR